MNSLFENYINSVVAKEFGEAEVNDPRIPINVAGWYWADRYNAKYTALHGVYATEEEALEAGRSYRRQLCERWDVGASK